MNYLDLKLKEIGIDIKKMSEEEINNFVDRINWTTSLHQFPKDLLIEIAKFSHPNDYEILKERDNKLKENDKVCYLCLQSTYRLTDCVSLRVIEQCNACGLFICNNCGLGCKSCDKIYCKKCKIIKECEYCFEYICKDCHTLEKCDNCNKLTCYLYNCGTCGNIRCEKCCSCRINICSNYHHSVYYCSYECFSEDNDVYCKKCKKQ